MPTEHDIRDALNAKADEAATELALALPSPTAHHGAVRRTLPVVGAVAATAAVAVAAALLVSHRNSPGAAASGPAGSGCGAATKTTTTLRYDFRVDGPNGFTYTPDSICSARQQLTVNVPNSVAHDSDLGTQPVPHGNVSVFKAGAFDPARARHGTPVTVDGHRGYYSTLPTIGSWHGPVSLDCAATDPGTQRKVLTGCPIDRPSLAWEYAPDSWAVVQAFWSQHPQADTQLIADQVRIGEQQPLRLPFRLGYVPAGLVAGGAEGVSVGLSDGTPAKSPDCTTASCGSAISVGVYTPGDPDALRMSGVQRIKVDGHDAVLYPNASELDVGFGDRTLLIRVDANHRGRYSDQDLIKIAQNVTMSASMDDQGTWFDATAVMPH
jgi:hypothetical protein